MRLPGWTALAAVAAGLGLALSGCDRTLDPDIGQRNTAAEQVIRAAKDGDRERLLDLALVYMQDREAGADSLIAAAVNLDISTYKVAYREHHGAPDNHVVIAGDEQGDDMSFELAWNDSKWQVALGSAGPPRSPV
ncbi:hypothetical protein [Paenarthrobacter nitroguajacolicus]|uniref:hypothetical protein n=1 Tax=Paenarthrobacter nitroguajacolicus TaxID=211146 RepID=UPI0028567809|nr:hypothetical protein [Paenarthrobacter nitroguajacolicus]MDR6637172.1 hypothetical protein [Paenarthrobacter nitroguajacolicus]